MSAHLYDSRFWRRVQLTAFGPVYQAGPRKHCGYPHALANPRDEQQMDYT